VSGVITVVVIAFLAYRMRAALGLLRSTAVERAQVVTPRPSTDLPVPDAAIYNAGMATAAGVADGTLGAAPTTCSEKVLAIPSANDVARPPLASQHVTAALPANGHGSRRQDFSATSPLYLTTVAALRWDPGRPRDTVGGQKGS
jgi:hypothetical protein